MIFDPEISKAQKPLPASGHHFAKASSISPSFKGFNFDIIWSPLIASMPGELGAVQTELHPPKHEAQRVAQLCAARPFLRQQRRFAGISC